MDPSHMRDKIILSVKSPAVKIDGASVLPWVQVDKIDVAQQGGSAGKMPRVYAAFPLALQDRFRYTLY